MEFDRLAAVIRPRTPWEGLDLGFALARRWFLQLFLLWWLTAMPILVLATLWLTDSPSLWVILAWWFKPLYEAPLLYWLARRLFGKSPGLRDLWRARTKILPLRLLPNLLWRRLHPSRSFQMPLLLLEGLRGKARRQRQQVLQAPGGTSAWLTVICLHLESILWLSALLLVAFMIPEELPGLDLSDAFLEEDSTPYWVSSLIYCLAMSVMGPFYVAAGFALYLARRTELEAWDLELQFRQAEQKAPRPRSARRPRSGPRSAATLICVGLTLSAVLPGDASALTLTRDRARAEIESVLQDEAFGHIREIQAWVYVGPPQEDDSDETTELPQWLIDLLKLLGSGGDLAAATFKWLLYLMGAVLILVILLRILRDLRGPRPSGKRLEPRTEPSRTLPPRVPTELPADVPAAVRALLDQGDLRDALALLYVASIAILGRRHGLEVPESATESEYLTLVLAQRPADEGHLMRRLVRTWQRLAYAHQEPKPAELEALVLDWDRWQGKGAHAG